MKEQRTIAVEKIKSLDAAVGILQKSVKTMEEGKFKLHSVAINSYGIYGDGDEDGDDYDPPQTALEYRLEYRVHISGTYSGE